MADLIVHLGLLKPWSIAQEVSVEREKSQKKPTLGKVGYQLETTALISKWNYNAFRIRCIMLILKKLNYHTHGANRSIPNFHVGLKCF